MAVGVSGEAAGEGGEMGEGFRERKFEERDLGSRNGEEVEIIKRLSGCIGRKA